MRARWHKEDTGRGTYLIVVTEIPWLVQKGRLVEKLAELINDKKLPLVADVRDESAEDIRLVIEPRSRTVDAELLMESLFKLTELESRIPLNMNVLVKGRIPRVVGLAEALSEWLAHRREVLLRRSKFRLGQIEHRLEVLGGYLIAYLNLDKVIKIIRNEDEPKPVLMKTFKLTDVQADAILNMRLRNLRKLEEMEIRQEDKDAARRAQDAQGAARLREGAMEDGRRRDQGGARRSSGRRRRSASAAPPSPQAPEHDEAAIEEALVEREPITVVVSEKGWIRALRGTVTDLSGIAFKADDGLEVRVPGRDHLEMPGVRHQRPLLHARRGEASRRPRPRRADPAVRRPGAGGRRRRRIPSSGRPQVPGREHARAAASSCRRTSASPIPARASRCSTSRCPTKRAPSRWSRASWSRPSARTARW